MSSGKDRAQPESLIDTPTERVLGSLPRAPAKVFERLLDPADESPQDSLERIPEYLAELERARATHEFLDIDLARKIGARCERLLRGIGPETPREHATLIQAAVRYFLLTDDADSDTESLIGFDDDARVVELVAQAVGREDILE